MPYPGEIISNLYQIEGQIGKGGAGIIYKAYHLNLHKYVVVKKIIDNFIGNINARGEADILKSLHHTSLPQVYDFIQIGNDIYTVMEFIDGHDLKYYIDNGCYFEENSLWFWLEQLTDVLAYLHGHGILHTDIKPANIMLTSEGNVFLIDFNISLNGEKNLTGISETYASIEQYRKWYGILNETKDTHIKLDGRTDIYSLGATFYHMMTGLRPSPTQADMIPITKMRLPYSGELVGIVDRMTKYDRNKRFHSAYKVKKTILDCKKTKAEKNTLRIVFALMSAAVLILCSVIFIITIRGGGTAWDEQINYIRENENKIEQLCSEGEYGQAKDEAVSFINGNMDLIENISGAKQSIFERTVDACMGAEDYALAAFYINELLKLEDKAQYYQNLAVINAWQGRFEQAHEAMDKALELGGNNLEIYKSRAEISAASKDYDAAIEGYKSIYDSDKSIVIARRIAYLSLAAANDCDNQINKTEYASCAIEWYEFLAGLNQASYNDRINLVSAYCICNFNEKAVSMLNSLMVDYPQNYEAFLKAAIMDYNAEIKKNPASRDFSHVKKYSTQARELFDIYNSGKRDEQLDNFLEIVSGMN